MTNIIRFAILACTLLSACEGVYGSDPFTYTGSDHQLQHPVNDPTGPQGEVPPTSEGWFGTIAAQNGTAGDGSDSPTTTKNLGDAPTFPAVDPYTTYKMTHRKDFTSQDLDAVSNYAMVSASCAPGDTAVSGTCSFQHDDNYIPDALNHSEGLSKTDYTCVYMPTEMTEPVFTVITIVTCLPAKK